MGKKNKKNANLKVVIIGFGSIGKRHYRNLKTLGLKEIFVYDSDKSKLIDLPFVLTSLNKESLSVFDAVFICAPNNKHLSLAKLSAEAGCHLFIEKPLSNNLTGLADLKKIADKKGLITMVGCNMRFHPSIKFIKKFIDSGRLGRIYGISHEFGYYLPLWRPGEDYRKNYAAKKSTGGGIVLDDIHEYDLLFWLNDFSPVLERKIIRNRSGDLAIETEDFAAGSFLFKNGVLGTVVSNYLSRSYRRNICIVGQKGNLTWDFLSNKVIFSGQNFEREIFSATDFDFNDVYKDEINYFFDCLLKSRQTFNSLEKAEIILRNIL